MRFGGYVKTKSGIEGVGCRAFPALAIRRRRYIWTILAVPLLIAALPLVAQVTTGSIVGVVYDPGGAVIANCKITAVDLETGAEREAQTNDSGYYTIPSLPPDAYKLTASVQGFAATTTRPGTGILLSVRNDCSSNWDGVRPAAASEART